MIGSVKTAWALVGHQLKNHGNDGINLITEYLLLMMYNSFPGQLPVEEKYYTAIIDDDTPMEYLVPTTSEVGVCTTALVNFLTLTHNNFIERCRVLVADNDQRYIDGWCVSCSQIPCLKYPAWCTGSSIWVGAAWPLYLLHNYRQTIFLLALDDIDTFKSLDQVTILVTETCMYISTF